MDSTQLNFSKQSVVGTQNTNQSNDTDHDVRFFRKIDVGILPPHSTLVFAEQKIDKHGSAYRLALGIVRIASKQHPLWVYLTSPGGRDCDVHFVYQDGKAVPREQHEHFTLVEPFCYLPKILPPTKNAKFSPLATVIVYYFVVAGKWPEKPPAGGHGYVDTPILRKACLTVRAGMRRASRLREHDDVVGQSSSSASTTLPALPLRLKREHDDSDLAAPTTKRVKIDAQEDQITKEQLLEAVNTEHKGDAELITKRRKALYIARVHSNWASDMFEKNIPEAAKESAKIEFDKNMMELAILEREFEASYGPVYW